MFVLLVLPFLKRERKNTEIFSYFLVKMCFYNFLRSFFYTHTNLITKFVYLFKRLACKMNICVKTLFFGEFFLRICKEIFLSIEGRNHRFNYLLF